MSAYRAAIIGTGRIGSRLEKDPLRQKPASHAGWYRHHPAIELVAGADIDEAALTEFGSDWGIGATRLFRDYHAMLAEVRPDIVSIAGWAPERYEMCRAALDAGARGLWIEKAIGCSIAEAELLREQIARAGAVAIVDHPRRADARYRAVRRLIEERAFGDLQTVNCLMSGNLMHTGTHAWDILLFWGGPWTSAQAWLDSPVERAGRMCDAGGHAHIVFEGGVHAYVTGRNKDYYVFQFDLVFSLGRVQIGNDVLRVLRPADSPRYSGFRELLEVTDVPLDDPWPHPMVYDLVDAMERRREPVMSVQNAVEAFRLGAALFQSHRDGHAVVTPGALDARLAIDSV
jgi:predicted dehydrogenase